MAGKGSVTIKIDGDASGFERTLRGIKQKTSSVLSGIGTVSKGVAEGVGVAYTAMSAAMSAASAPAARMPTMVGTVKPMMPPL